MHEYSPAQVVEILRFARRDLRSPALERVLECFKRRWLRWARRRYPGLDAQHEDAVQEAQVLVLNRLDQLRDPARVEAWANAVFRSVLLDMFKKHSRRGRWHRDVKSDEDPDDRLAQLPSAGPGPEDDVSLQERERIVRKIVRVDEAAWLKFEEHCTDKEIEASTGLSRDAIATRCKRIRLVLKRLLDDTDEDGKPLPAAKIVEGTGLSRELREKIITVIERLRRRNDGKE